MYVTTSFVCGRQQCHVIATYLHKVRKYVFDLAAKRISKRGVKYEVLLSPDDDIEFLKYFMNTILLKNYSTET